jgi:hypothetical protein
VAFSVQILVALSAAARFHVGHPKVVGVTSYDMHGLPEA